MKILVFMSDNRSIGVSLILHSMIRQWYSVDLPAKNENRAWEQDALWNAMILDEWMFEEKEGQYLRHITSYQTGGLRIPYFKDFIVKHGLNMKNNTFIKQVAFDTSDATQFGF